MTARITELWAIIVVDEDGGEGIACYPMSDVAMIALDREQRSRIIADAQRSNAVWQKSLRLARFELKNKELV